MHIADFYGERKQEQRKHEAIQDYKFAAWYIAVILVILALILWA